MNPYLSITYRTFTIWIMASVINGMLSGSLLTIAGNGSDRLIPMTFLAGLCSLLFSIPGFFVFWMVMLEMLRRNIMGRSLFRAALSTAIILAIATGIISSGLFRSVSGDKLSYLFPVSIVISAIASIMMHFRMFKKIQ